MSIEKFKEEYAPFFGDIIFTKQKTTTSKGLRIAQQLPSIYKKDKESYSHVAFVINSLTIIEATGEKGVDMCYFKDLFKRKKLIYKVLRHPSASENFPVNATYYLGQNYDKEFISRFLKKKPHPDKQVCSTLVANMLINFDLLEIQNPDFITPNELLKELKDSGWVDITCKYEKCVKLKNEGEDFSTHVDDHSDTVKFIQSNKKKQLALHEALQKILQVQLNIVRDLNLGSELEVKLESELTSLKEMEQVNYAFHDTDPLSKNIFTKQ